MSRPRHLADHLTVEELEQRYRACKCPVERTRLQAVWLTAKEWSTVQILGATGLSRTAFQEALRHYNADGPDALRDRRHANPGRPPIVRGEVRERLLQALQGPAPDGGVWSGRKVADWVAAALGREQVHEKQGWRVLKQLGYSPQRPRPRHAQTDLVAQEEVKKGGSPPP